jgi:ABC-type nickel/cobalt efflux system permease component RcnA
MNLRPAILCLASVLALVVAFAAAPGPSLAARNPFLGGGGAQTRERNATAGRSPTTTMASNAFLQRIAGWQLALRRHMTGLARELRASPWGRSLWLFLLASFAYGAAHALGPGHGKAFAMAYFLDKPGPVGLGLMFGNLSMFFHVLSAALLVLAGTYVLETAASGLVDDAGVILEGVSYGLLFCIGVALLAGRALSLWRRRREPVRQNRTDRAGWKGLVATAMAAGLVPCPGAALVLLFCISLGVRTAGLLSLLAISLGMGATISLFATATILSRSVILNLLHGRGRLFQAVHAAVSLAGGLAMSGLGLLLFTGWWLSR